FVVNTHWHFDHTGGNENMGAAGAILVAHENVRARMSVDQFMKAFDRAVPASPPGALPVITFTDAMTFHWNGDDLHVFHVDPAHTDGDAIIHFKGANAVHMGDTYFSGMYPFIDVGSGGSIDGMIAAADEVLALADDATKIIPGHGPLSNKAELHAYRDMLATARDRIHALISEGKSQEEVVAAKPTSDLDAEWGGGFMQPDVWVGIVYASMAEH
ncbi:MAG: MBL fold metallo-hydrolase, partial [Bacteroidetes bacterium]|nr:MBL fold metallo-hydrolase [Bacteroidota bacterium]